MMKKLLAVLLTLCMVFALCACGAGSDKKEDEKNNNAVNNEVNDDADDESKDESDEDEGVQTQAGFQVKIVDEGGNPVQGCMVQVCKDTCLPAISNAEGIAIFNLQIEDGHKLQVSNCPEGYTYDGEADIYLEPGQKEYALVLKAVK